MSESVTVKYDDMDLVLPVQLNMKALVALEKGFLATFLEELLEDWQYLMLLTKNPSMADLTEIIQDYGELVAAFSKEKEEELAETIAKAFLEQLGDQ